MPMINITPEEVDAICAMIYDDVTCGYTNLSEHVAGYEINIAKDTLARARITLTFLAKCGVQDAGLMEEVDVLQQTIKENE
jgi:hypothetical protein